MNKNLTNQKFGRLTVTSMAPNMIIDDEKRTAWYCTCECGGGGIASTDDLLSGRVVSCGCAKDLSGQKFGNLIVKPFSEVKDKEYWLCECCCGNLKMIPTSKLLSGTVTSCGCHDITLGAPNKYDLTSEDYGIGYCLNDGSEFYFDKEDFDKIKDYRWNRSNNKYEYIVSYVNGKSVFMQSLLIDVPKNTRVYFIGAVNDLRKSNISTTKPSNRIKSNSTNNSGVVGVSYDNTNKRWFASLRFNGVLHSKRFKTKEEAIAQRKSWENEFYGDESK